MCLPLHCTVVGWLCRNHSGGKRDTGYGGCTCGENGLYRRSVNPYRSGFVSFPCVRARRKVFGDYNSRQSVPRGGFSIKGDPAVHGSPSFFFTPGRVRYGEGKDPVLHEPGRWEPFALRSCMKTAYSCVAGILPARNAAILAAIHQAIPRARCSRHARARRPRHVFILALRGSG